MFEICNISQVSRTIKYQRFFLAFGLKNLEKGSRGLAELNGQGEGMRSPAGEEKGTVKFENKEQQDEEEGGETKPSATQWIQIGRFTGFLRNRCRNEEDLCAIKCVDFQKRPNGAVRFLQKQAEGKTRISRRFNIVWKLLRHNVQVLQKVFKEVIFWSSLPCTLFFLFSFTRRCLFFLSTFSFLHPSLFSS